MGMGKTTDPCSQSKHGSAGKKQQDSTPQPAGAGMQVGRNGHDGEASPDPPITLHTGSLTATPHRSSPTGPLGLLAQPNR